MDTSDQGIIAAYDEEHAERLTGVTRSQLRYWDRTGFFSPTYGDAEFASIFGRVYTFKDIVSLRVLGTLRRQGVSLPHLRQSKERLALLGYTSWTGVKLYVQNKKVVWVEPDTKVPQEILSGQYVMRPVIELDVVIAETRRQIVELNRRSPEKIGQVEQRRAINQNSPIIAGTRIPVRAIKRFHDAGYSDAQILAEYPDLTESDIKAALEYQRAA